MSDKLTAAEERFQEKFEILRQTIAMLKSATTADEQRYYWSTTIDHCHKATEALVALSMASTKTRHLGHMLKNEQKQCNETNYIFRSRNIENHPNENNLNQGPTVEQGHLRVPGVFNSIGGGMQNFSKNLIILPDGSAVPLDFQIDMNKSSEQQLFPKDLPIDYRPNTFRLREVSDQQSKLYAVPRINGETDASTAIRLAEIYANFIGSYAKQTFELLKI